jgi:hypothetical protein
MKTIAIVFMLTVLLTTLIAVLGTAMGIGVFIYTGLMYGLIILGLLVERKG